MKLIGDIGGTKVALALIDGQGERVAARRLASADFSSFDDLLADYLGSRRDKHDISAACLAVAGPIAPDGRSAKVTNLPWFIDAATLARLFGINHVMLVNDFSAVAAGIRVAPPAQLICLQSGQADDAGVRLALGAGTGMGVAALMGDRILPSEGGHVGFAPQDETQLRLWSALHRAHGRVTVERVISGAGLAAIHHILTGEALSPEAIGTRALAGDASARTSVDTFFACYGAFAGDMALTFLARGGVFLAGGVTQKLLPLIAGSPFMAQFNAKAEHEALARSIPVYAIRDPEIGLSGAANLIFRKQV